MDRRRAFLFVAATACLAAMQGSFAAPPPRPARGPGPGGGKPPGADAGSPLRQALVDRIGALEEEIAQLAQSRASTPPAQLSYVEFAIDMRIVARWTYTWELSTKEGSEHRTITHLRSVEMDDVIDGLDKWIPAQQGRAVTRSQSEAMTRLRQLTYKLSPPPKKKEVNNPDANDGQSAPAPAAHDDLYRSLAREMSAAMALGDAPLPSMRPKPRSPEPGNDVKKPPVRSGPPTLAELSALSRQMAVSQNLRRELMALATAAEAAAGDGSSDRTDADELKNTLSAAIDLAGGLQGGVAVSAEDRSQIEARLTTALSLYTDVRTRAAGAARLASLDQYRHVLARIGKLNLPPDLQQQFGPALAYTRTHQDSANKVMDSLHRYVELVNAFATRQKPAEKLPPNVERAIDDQTKAFESSRQSFLSDAASLGDNTGLMNSNSTPDELAKRLDEMKREADLVDVLGNTPAMLQTLNGFKPRPTGGIDKRVTQQITILAAPPIGKDAPKPGARDDAAKLLTELHAFAKAADALSQRPADDLPGALLKQYTGAETLAPFEAKWKSLVTDVASTVSAGGAIDMAKIDRLRRGPALLDALKAAAAMEKSVAACADFDGWADWTLTADQTVGLLKPYRDGLANAFAAFGTDDGGSIDAFFKLSPRYAPLAELFERSSFYAEGVKALPQGLQGNLAKLATPMEGNPPFGPQRATSSAADAMTIDPGASGADSPLSALLATLSKLPSSP